MNNLYKWVKNKGTDVYEGRHAISASQMADGVKYFLVFISKKGFKINTDGVIIYTPFKSEFIGSWLSRRDASHAVRNIDIALATKGIHTLKVNMPSDNTSFTYSVKNGSVLMVLDEKHPDDEYHEMGHILSDTVMTGESLKEKLVDEKKALRIEIDLMKNDGVYTPRFRKSLLSNERCISFLAKGHKRKALSILHDLENNKSARTRAYRKRINDSGVIVNI